MYVTDALKVIGENTAHFAGGSSMRLRWLDVIDPAPEPVVDNRPAEEIAADIWARARIGKGGE